jgi:hypothetical protein
MDRPTIIECAVLRFGGGYRAVLRVAGVETVLPGSEPSTRAAARRAHREALLLQAKRLRGEDRERGCLVLAC